MVEDKNIDGAWTAVEIRGKRKESRSVLGFELARPDGGRLPPFEAGAHVRVRLPSGLVRHYSLCGVPSAVPVRAYRLGVLNRPQGGGGSRELGALDVGSVIEISEPANFFPLAADAVHSTLIAGGIGITPVLAMARALHEAGGAFDVHYLARSAEHAAFVDEISEAAWGAQARFHFDTATDAGQRRTHLAGLLPAYEAGRHVYVCGPAALMESVAELAREAQWPEEAIHREEFEPPSAGIAAKNNRAFTMVLRQSGLTLTVPPEMTALDVLEANDVFVPSSCRLGLCGTCITTVIDGLPAHRDQYLSEVEHAQNKLFTPCCSRAETGTLVLDL